MKKNNNLVFAKVDLVDNEVPLTVIQLPMVLISSFNYRCTILRTDLNESLSISKHHS
jgi:hypothetical protein